MHVVHIPSSSDFPPSWLADPATPAWFLCVVAALVVVPAIIDLFRRRT